MASPSTFVNLSDADLKFTESTTTHTFGQVPDSAVDDFETEDDQAGLLHQDDQESRSQPNRYNFWSLEFYQQFFDVDTDEVKGRMLAAMLPKPGRPFLSDVLRKKPDLYGPLWICTTLVISVAVSGNLASYFQNALENEQRFIWHYDFHKVTLAATAVFTYAWLVPAIIYGFLWWTASGALSTLSFLELICLYGYSLVIYIPVSVLWLIQNSAVQWTLVLVGAGLSGGVIVLTLWPIFKENAGKAGVILILVIVALHLLLACGFMLYFFHVPNEGHVSEISIQGKSDNKTTPEQANQNDEAAKAEKTSPTAKQEKSIAEKVTGIGVDKPEQKPDNIKEDVKVQAEKDKKDDSETSAANKT